MKPEFTLKSVEVSLTPERRFEEYLQSRGMRNTQQRRYILDAIYARHDHFDADMLIGQLPSKGKKGYVSRPTVYRTLIEFVDAGLLRRFELDGRAVYEHDYGYPQHDHLHCTRCDTLFEFQSEKLFAIRNQVAQDQNFRVIGHRLIISGICEKCNRSPRRQRRKQDLI
jgi:Fur family transcriptional regulator, ferric uptake regulator